MVTSIIIIIFIFSCISVYFIFIAISHITGDSKICVGKDDKPYTGIGISTGSCVCLEVNTHTETLDYFINDQHIKDHVVTKRCVFRSLIFYLLFVFIY
jgi:hypothetical protein